MALHLECPGLFFNVTPSRKLPLTSHPHLILTLYIVVGGSWAASHFRSSMSNSQPPRHTPIPGRVTHWIKPVMGTYTRKGRWFPPSVPPPVDMAAFSGPTGC